MSLLQYFRHYSTKLPCFRKFGHKPNWKSLLFTILSKKLHDSTNVEHKRQLTVHLGDGLEKKKVPAWSIKQKAPSPRGSVSYLIFNTLGQTTADLISSVQCSKKNSRVKNWRKIKFKSPFSTNIWNLLLNSEGKMNFTIIKIRNE